MDKHSQGFTLIETLIYIGLFSIIITGGFVTAYQLLQGYDILGSKTITQDEINFVLRKIDWTINGTSTSALLIAPSATTPYSSTLSFVRPDGIRIDIRLNITSNSVEMREGGVSSPFLPITTSNVKVTNLGFRYVPPIGLGAPSGVEATTTINSMPATTTKYFRK